MRNSCTLPSQTKQEFLQRLEQLLIDFSTGNKLLHEGTERTCTTVDYEDQQAYYNDKKKHTVKKAVITSMLCTVLFVG